MIKNYSISDIKKNIEIQKNFLNAKFNDLNFDCNIYKGNFFIDSFNYFVINEDYKTFKSLFTRDVFQQNDHFYSKEFFENFSSKVSSFKEFKNVFVLGSNSADNYFSNLIQFLPRIFFNKNKKIKLAIHRNSSSKFREFIKLILQSKETEFSFVYLDENFYYFRDSEIPQFLSLDKSIKILKKFLLPNSTNIQDKKIYVTREDSQYRKIVNEADIIPILREKGYKVINPRLYKIDEQIRIFSNADKIVAPYGSNLANIIFCKPNTKIYEIGPSFDNVFEKQFENRYRYIATQNNLKYTRLITDTVKIKNHSDLAKKYINKNILQNSNYYNNLIVKINDIKSIE